MEGYQETRPEALARQLRAKRSEMMVSNWRPSRWTLRVSVDSTSDVDARCESSVAQKSRGGSSIQITFPSKDDRPAWSGSTARSDGMRAASPRPADEPPLHSLGSR